MIPRPANAASSWTIHEALRESGVYVRYLNVWPFENPASSLKDEYARQFPGNYVIRNASISSAPAADGGLRWGYLQVIVFNDADQTVVGGGAAGVLSTGSNSGFRLRTDGKDIINPVWLPQEGLLVPGVEGMATTAVRPPLPGNRQTVAMVIAVIVPRNDPDGIVIDAIFDSPETNLLADPAAAEFHPTWVAGWHYLDGRMSNSGTIVQAGPTSYAEDGGVAVTFNTTRQTLAVWGVKVTDPGASGNAKQGSVELVVSNGTEPLRVNVGPSGFSGVSGTEFARHPENWSLKFNIKGSADVWFAAADVPYALADRASVRTF